MTVINGAGVADARTMLFVPGDRPERFAKASATRADLVIIDLEDAVGPGHKDAARQEAARWVDTVGPAAVRINGVGASEHAADVRALAGLPQLRAVVVPMAEDPGALVALHQRFGPQVAIVALIETAVGMVRALEIAGATGVTRLAFGHLDFAADIDAATSDEAMRYARSTLVVAARAAGLPGPVDGVTTDLTDPGRAAADAERARGLGFTGKFCIHPAQVEAVNGAFTPDVEQVRWARRVVAASGAGGALRVDGQMVDAPVIRRAEAVLRRAGAERDGQAQRG
ncbi:CoA ester lyase [Micromonospora zingiberis]|uniref:CoA ester lyase n=1 Tax=Micromonospora zingiberis TaxID=2053011 RepID=A0A4R0GIJ7_9ACTN|nr:CoA ester lyase [Micromonospora zingiberis]TCB97230.1 CoA ester lyase [Micromonospora zingiberis]